MGERITQPDTAKPMPPPFLPVSPALFAEDTTNPKLDCCPKMGGWWIFCPLCLRVSFFGWTAIRIRAKQKRCPCSGNCRPTNPITPFFRCEPQPTGLLSNASIRRTGCGLGFFLLSRLTPNLQDIFFLILLVPMFFPLVKERLTLARGETAILVGGLPFFLFGCYPKRPIHIWNVGRFFSAALTHDYRRPPIPSCMAYPLSGLADNDCCPIFYYSRVANARL